MDSIELIIKEGYETEHMPLPDITEWSRIAPELLKNNDYEAIRITKYRYLRAYNIIHHRDAPDPKPLFPDTFDMDMSDAITDSNEFDWHKATEILAKEIQFAFTDELLYYNPINGVWENDAERIILYALDRAYKGRITRHLEGEIISEIKRESMVIGDFGQQEGFVNCINGVIDIRDGTIHKHSPEYRFRYVIPVRYDYKARADKTLKFLEDVFKDDLNKALKTLEIFAYPFLPGYPIQKAVTLLGRGNNGKSVTLSILSALLGKKNIASIPLQSIAHNRFAAVELQFKLANVSGDVSGGKLQDTSTFKMLTGGDYVSGERKNLQKRIEFMNSAKMIFAFNQLPKTNDQTSAFFRRFEILKFIQDFTGREDRTLTDKLTTNEELAGLLNLLISVFLPALMKTKIFHMSMTLEEQKREYNLSSDPALAFIQEHIISNPDGQAIAEDLYNKYVAWCNVQGLNISTKESFGNSLMNQSGFIVQKRRIQEGGVQKNYYVGIRYIEEQENEKGYIENTEQEFKNIQEAIKFYKLKYL